MHRSVRRPRSPFRLAGLRVALVLGCAAVVVAFAEGGAPVSAGRSAATPPAPAATRRAAPPRARVRFAADPVADPVAEASPAAPEPVVAPAPVTEERKIRLVDESRRPVVGATIDFNDGPDPETNADGEVTYTAVAGATTSLVYDDGFVRRRIEVREAITELVVARADVVVQTIDGFTGAAMPTGGVSLYCNWFGTPSATEAQSCGAVLPSAPAKERTLRLRIETLGTTSHAPAGDLDWNRPISITARRVRIDVPVFPLRNVALRPVSEVGEDVSEVEFAGARLESADQAEAPYGLEAIAAGRAGDALLVRVPRVPANLATFELASPSSTLTESWLEGTSSLVAIGSLGDDSIVEVPVRRVSEWSGEGSYGHSSSGCGCRAARETVSVNVRVLRRDGSPAPHVRVRGYSTATTGPDGTATVRCDPSGHYIVAAAHGFLPSHAHAPAGLDTLGPDAVVEIVESSPRRVRVVVVDGDDRPVPSARVFAESTGCAPVRTIAQMDGDTEIGTPRTDADGAIVLDVCDGKIRYDVSLAGAATSVESDASEVRVVLGASPPATR